LRKGIAPRVDVSRIAEFAKALGVDLSTTLFGEQSMPHPIGLAAGFDKNAECILGCQRVGFAFVEVGTVTPLAQPGNPKPRLWRQKSDFALVNAMGFNNAGAKNSCENVMRAKEHGARLPLGINIGKNKITTASDALRDYEKGFHEAARAGDFFVVNISSPNTPGLRDLATPEFIAGLARTCGTKNLSRTWIKLSPDIEKSELQALIHAVKNENFAGVVLSNTHKLDAPWQGGQSGKPILNLANRVLEWAWEVHQGCLPTIASGGIFSGADALAKIERGANAVEIFTAFIYRGPLAIELIVQELALEMRNRGFTNIASAKGAFFKTRS
jgi:dihydroorotate dehydrogenase